MGVGIFQRLFRPFLLQKIANLNTNPQTKKIQRGSLANLASISEGKKTRIESVASDLSNNKWINIEFEDGSRHKFLTAWLRDNCKCKACWDPTHAFKMTDTWVPSRTVTAVQTLVLENGELEVTWSDDKKHKSSFRPQWLLERGRAMAERKINVNAVRDKHPHQRKILWTNSILEDAGGQPEVTYDAFMSGKEGAELWMKYFHQFGFVNIKGAPTSELAIRNVAHRLTFIRETSFGVVSEVLIGPESNLHPAYTGLTIHLHTDLTYKERSPGILSLQCVKNAIPENGEEGGMSQIADGMQVAQWVKQHEPEAFHLLSTIPIPYSYTDPTTGICYHAFWPVIGLDPVGNLREIHFSNFARRTLDFETKLLEKVYEALEVFADRLYDQESVRSFYLRPGDILTMNNRRVLHARSSFDPNKVSRHLRSIYMDLDEIEGLYDAILNGKSVKI